MIIFFSIGAVFAIYFLAFYARSVVRLRRSGKPYHFDPVLAVFIAVGVAAIWPLFVVLAVKDALKGCRKCKEASPSYKAVLEHEKRRSNND